MQQLLSIYKPSGLTPLQVINSIKKQRPELANEKITYAGRLDPLAHGVLLLLIGEEAKKRKTYLDFLKTYEFEAVFGLETDTYDVLGLVKAKKEIVSGINVNLFVNTFVKSHLGKQLQFYPPYSSKAINGKPLFWWARNNRLDEIEMPTREIKIYDFRCVSIGNISVKDLKQKVEASITSVHGDFRQKEIWARWEEVCSTLQNKTNTLPTAKFYLNCSSGTYVRELVHQLGKAMSCGAIAIDILRTAVGEYTIKNAEKL